MLGCIFVNFETISTISEILKSCRQNHRIRLPLRHKRFCKHFESHRNFPRDEQSMFDSCVSPWPTRLQQRLLPTQDTVSNQHRNRMTVISDPIPPTIITITIVTKVNHAEGSLDDGSETHRVDRNNISLRLPQNAPYVRRGNPNISAQSAE
jgi:hypothetical protein